MASISVASAASTRSLHLFSHRLDLDNTPPFTVYPTLYTETSSHVAPT